MAVIVWIKTTWAVRLFQKCTELEILTLKVSSYNPVYIFSTFRSREASASARVHRDKVRSTLQIWIKSISHKKYMGNQRFNANLSTRLGLGNMLLIVAYVCQHRIIC